MEQTKYQFTDKWSGNIKAHGYTMIPNLLIENQHHFNLSPSEFTTLCHILNFKWDRNDPYPSLKTISKRCGISTHTVRKNVRRLESKGILKRKYRKGETTEYSFRPLIERLDILAVSQRPRQKRIPPSYNSNSPPYAKTHTKEDLLMKKNIKRPTRFSKGFSKIGNHLPRKYEEKNE